MNLMNFLAITCLLLPGILLMAKDEERLYQSLLKDEKLPAFGVRMLNHIILAFPLAILGLFFFESVGFAWISPNGISLWTVVISVAVALGNAAFYYLYFKQNVPKETYEKIEQSRSLGILTRMFYGGILEEIVFRFGFMSFFAWLFHLWFSNILWSIWLANILAAVLFTLAHLPSVYQLKVTNTKLIFLYMNSANGILGLICGWLYWTEGLAAAIICHMTFHIVWYIAEKIEPKFHKYA